MPGSAAGSAEFCLASSRASESAGGLVDISRLVLLRFTVPLSAGYRQPVGEATGAASVPASAPADKPYARRKIR